MPNFVVMTVSADGQPPLVVRKSADTMMTKCISHMHTGQMLLKAWIINHYHARLIKVNSLAPGKSGCIFKNATFNLVLLISIFRYSYDDALRLMPWDLTEDKSPLLQIMAWCYQATSHCWCRFMLLNRFTRPQWIKLNTKWKILL